MKLNIPLIGSLEIHFKSKKTLELEKLLIALSVDPAVPNILAKRYKTSLFPPCPSINMHPGSNVWYSGIQNQQALQTSVGMANSQSQLGQAIRFTHSKAQ
jgi:hypothetical protein